MNNIMRILGLSMLMLFGFATPVSADNVDFEGCRKAIEVSETDTANMDENGTGDTGYRCDVWLSETVVNKPGSACEATVRYVVQCAGPRRIYSYEGGACCPFN